MFLTPSQKCYTHHWPHSYYLVFALVSDAICLSKWKLYLCYHHCAGNTVAGIIGWLPSACIPTLSLPHHFSHQVAGISTWAHTQIGIHSTLFPRYHNSIQYCAWGLIDSAPLFDHSPEHTVSGVYNNSFSANFQTDTWQTNLGCNISIWVIAWWKLHLAPMHSW